MTFPPRRLPAALLQVDAIVGRLSGKAALDEVARYLGEEFSSLEELSFYKVDGTSARRAGGSEPGASAPSPMPDAVVQVISNRVPLIGATGTSICLPVLEGDALVGVVRAVVRGAALDAGDRRFLGDVVRRTAAVLSQGEARLL